MTSPTALTAIACALSCVAGDRHLLSAEKLGAGFLALHKPWTSCTTSLSAASRIGGR
jgi:hypothetical protein